MLHIVDGETYLRARFGAASLQGSASRKNSHHLHAEVGEDSCDGAAETCAVRQQNYHRSDAPGHAQHRQRGTTAVVLDGRGRLPSLIGDQQGTPSSNLPPYETPGVFATGSIRLTC